MDGPGVFTRHIETEHNMWAYLNFIIFIKQQDQDDDDGLEQYVRRCLDKKDIGWFPSNKCLMMKEKGEDKEEVMADELSKIRLLCERMEESTNQKLSNMASDMEKLKSSQKHQIELAHLAHAAATGTPAGGGMVRKNTMMLGRRPNTGDGRPKTGERIARGQSPVMPAIGDGATEEYCEV
jgi:hypothetical protein